MIISVYWSKTIVITFLLLCAYALSVTLNHVVQTLVASALGDTTAEREGWLTLNPLEHIDPIGVILLLLINFAWVTMLPFNEAAIRNPHRNFKLITFYLTQPLIACFFALITLTLLISWFGASSLGPALALFFSGPYEMSLSDFIELYPTRSSLSIIGALFLMALVVYNLFIAVVSFIANGLRLAFTKLREWGYIQEYSPLTLWLATFVVLVFYSAPLYNFIFKVLIILSTLIGRAV
jgi:hypothetical protein